MTIEERIESWLNSPIDEDTRKSILHLKEQNGEEIADSFYKDLEFGTGGMRGIMGVGPNRMNKYTIGMATQGLSNYLLRNFEGKKIKVAIAYDNRNNSQFFAETAANILSGNGIEVFLFENLRPTPELSFAVRNLQCQSGIVITASHNPREYNGYKVYWDDGGQILPPHDSGIIAEIREITKFEKINFKGDSKLIHLLGEPMDKQYLEAIKPFTHSYPFNKNLSIVFTPLHGTGATLIPGLLKELGFEKVKLVKEQAEPDGDFPTVVFPNPEEAEALSKAVELAKEINADLIMATDPDSDRVGIAVRDHEGEYHLINGNQTGILLLNYLIDKTKNKENAFIAKTIVTTDLIDEIARQKGVRCYNTLTGFKYIAEVIRKKPNEEFIAGCEESYGYMIGDFVRDKDAVSACAVIAELASAMKDKGKTLLDLLKDIYLEFGLYKERLFTLTRKGKTGAGEIINMMNDFRNHPPDEINESKVVRSVDYKENKDVDMLTGEVNSTGQPVSDVLQFFTEDGSKISVRPSGTEPKIKFYFSVHRAVNQENFSEISHGLDNQLDDIIKSLKLK
ncbi:MAG TPA: phospho-sugar mutase [Cyclobacteriaceae bacterium]|jgi:phosphoglucomutase